MSVLASADTKTLWEIALGMGLVVIVVVIILMVLLLSFVRNIQQGAEQLVQTAGELAGNTSSIGELAVTARVLEDIKSEALVHHGYLSEQVGGR
jgi:hypothetical protein